MVLVSLEKREYQSSDHSEHIPARACRCECDCCGTHKRKAAVCTPINLWLIDVDEDLGMTERSPSTVTRHHPVVRPPYWLLVYQVDGRQRLWLQSAQQLALRTSLVPLHKLNHTWYSINVCSNLGPTIALLRGC